MSAPIDSPYVFSDAEKRQLLTIAREAVNAAAHGEPAPELDLSVLSPSLTRPAACFVTLHINGARRGCTGSLAARRPLAEEVRVTAVQTALHDPRFPAVSPGEMPQIDIEVSVLTPERSLPYKSPEDLVHKLRPGIDGVTLRHGLHRATFLPQVWERVSDPEHFLSMLSRKMGLDANAWREGDMEVNIYQVVAWNEEELGI